MLSIISRAFWSLACVPWRNVHSHPLLFSIWVVCHFVLGGRFSHSWRYRRGETGPVSRGAGTEPAAGSWDTQSAWGGASGDNNPLSSIRMRKFPSRVLGSSLKYFKSSLVIEHARPVPPMSVGGFMVAGGSHEFQWKPPPRQESTGAARSRTRAPRGQTQSGARLPGIRTGGVRLQSVPTAPDLKTHADVAREPRLHQELPTAGGQHWTEHKIKIFKLKRDVVESKCRQTAVVQRRSNPLWNPREPKRTCWQLIHSNQRGWWVTEYKSNIQKLIELLYISRKPFEEMTFKIAKRRSRREKDKKGQGKNTCKI